MVSAGGAIENPTRIREIRKAIAQVLTVENEKKIAEEKTASKKTKKKRKEPTEKKAEKAAKPAKATEEKKAQ